MYPRKLLLCVHPSCYDSEAIEEIEIETTKEMETTKEI